MLGILSVSLLRTAHANVSDIQFKPLSDAEGLVQTAIIDIAEDKHGFMWFATMEGLKRFDGYDIVQYHHAPDDSNSLPDEFVRKLFIDSRQRLWVGTFAGIGRYRPQTDDFVTYTTSNSALTNGQVWTIAEAQDGSILVADAEGLYAYQAANDRFVAISATNQDMPADIRQILAEPKRTWLGTNGNGIFMLNEDKTQLYDLSRPNPWGLNLTAKFLFDLKRINDQYWLATEQGVFVIDDEHRLVSHLHSNSDVAIAGDNVRSITQHPDGEIWLGTTQGLSIVQPSLNSSLSIDDSNDVNVGLSDRFVIKTYVDTNGTLWLGTYAKGVLHYNQQYSLIRHHQRINNSPNALSDDIVWAIEEGAEGNIWIATQNGGINEFFPESGIFRHFLQDTKHNIWDFAIDDQGRFWVGATGGVYLYERHGDKLVEVAHMLRGEVIYYLEYFENHVWISTKDGGMTVFDTQTLSPRSVAMPNTNVVEMQPLAMDSRHNLWVRTNLGLATYNAKTDQFNQLIISTNTEKTIYLGVFEQQDTIWVATSEDGILGLDPQTYKVKTVINDWPQTARHRFINAVYKDGRVWLAAPRSIIEVDLGSGAVKTNIGSDLLEQNTLNEGAALATRNGLILFGGTDGFHVINAERLNTKAIHTAEAPLITGLSIYNRPVTLRSEKSPLTTPIYLTDKIYLESHHSPFSLSFSQVNPLVPEAQSYRYRVEGLNDNWLDADPRTRQATFTNLMFGSYTFQVQSRHGDGSWSPVRELNIVINPPIWLHRNAIIMYGFFAFLLLAYWFKQYKSRRNNQIAIQESEERLKLTLWSSGDELWDWDIYRGQVFRANTWGTLDFPQDDIRANSSYQANIHADDIARVQQALREHLDDKTDHFQVTYRAKTFKGNWVWLLDRGKVVKRDSNQQPVRMTGTLKNISDLKQAEEQLKLFKRSFETISDGVFITDTDFRFISVNQAYCQCTGETREQALASYLKFHQYPDAFTEEVKKTLQQKGNWFGEVESRRTNGEKYEMELNIDAIHSDNGRVTHYVGVFSDITTRKSTEKELLKLANTDPLTEMPNRSFFQGSHGNLVRKGIPHALICLDMDNFKKINDSLGHQTGDILIKQIGKRLQKLSGTHSTCYRLGGDEFSILVDNPGEMHRITHFTQQILDNMARPFVINKQEFVLGASVGIAFYPEDGNTPQELLKNADTAMYFAKNAGGNKYQFFSGEMNQSAVRQLQIENLIRHGLKEDLFTVFYQPKVDIATGKLVSMEALVRFEHPDKGIVSPSQFIPLAEETGQIVDIGEKVMEKACMDTKRWVAMGLFTGRVAINISARQFELPDLDDRIDRILKRVGLSPLHLECEITEGTLMQNPDQALRMMQRLRERGIHLALDDFGTGYSSLAYLKRFPLNTLKIDKAFIDDIANSSVDKHMTAAIINIAHNLGLKVVAEGVEQEKQLAILRRYECEMLQGYLYSKPLSSPRFERLLSENQHLSTLITQNDYN
ncbi:EAL domain-containing protein [Aestuariibacter halophilus]|uniref:EAL domain-containing protein n=1 Tax=Fluctibacter halophilus TaxID=226011 RepID=A0ABS8G3W4_9ALTE|nr:EAL domain-containing protein [Aestuariibacter halophilus]MCC2615173.1 EAL domain-containing protein [Aestuariibacter halophilus]